MLKRLLKRLRPRPVTPIMDRARGLEEELKFWRGWFEQRGGEWPDDYRRRFDPNLPLQEELAALARAHPATDLDLLDVGAGPVTRLGKHLAGKVIHLTPTDFLAPRYNALIDELGVKPLVRTQFADAERLVEAFGVERFDLVHAQNCVDHMENAWRAIEQMIAVLRPGGTLYLRHEEHEGRRNQYFSIHYWDFWLDDASGHFMIRKVNESPFDVTDALRPRGALRSYREGNRVVLELTKPAA